jgi:hypothetical protein
VIFFPCTLVFLSVLEFLLLGEVFQWFCFPKSMLHGYPLEICSATDIYVCNVDLIGRMATQTSNKNSSILKKQLLGRYTTFHN